MTPEASSEKQPLPTQKIIQGLVEGDRLAGIIGRHFCGDGASTDELIAMSGEDMDGSSPDKILRWLVGEQARAGYPDNSVVGYLQLLAIEPMTDRIAGASHWRDLVATANPEGYQGVVRDYRFMHYPPDCHDFMMGVSGLIYDATIQSVAQLRRDDPKAMEIACAARMHKVIARAHMRSILDDAPGLCEQVIDIEDQVAAGTLLAHEGKAAIWEATRQAAGFAIPQQVADIAINEYMQEGQVWEKLSGDVLLHDKVDNARALFGILIGHAVLRYLLGTPLEQIGPDLLSEDIPQMAHYTSLTNSGSPFIDVVSNSPVRCDFRRWLDTIRALQRQASLDGSKLVLPATKYQHRGKCPMQYSATAKSSNGKEPSPAAESLRAYCLERHGLEIGFSALPSIGELTLAATALGAMLPGGLLDARSGKLESIARFFG